MLAAIVPRVGAAGFVRTILPVPVLVAFAVAITRGSWSMIRIVGAIVGRAIASFDVFIAVIVKIPLAGRVTSIDDGTCGQVYNNAARERARNNGFRGNNIN